MGRSPIDGCVSMFQFTELIFPKLQQKNPARVENQLLKFDENNMVESKNEENHGWSCVAGGFLIHLVLGTLYCWGI
jgi:hypothetical protein